MLIPFILSLLWQYQKKRKLVTTSIFVCSRNVHQWVIARHILVLQAHYLHSPAQSLNTQLLEDFYPQKMSCNVNIIQSGDILSSMQQVSPPSWSLDMWQGHRHWVPQSPPALFPFHPPDPWTPSWKAGTAPFPQRVKQGVSAWIFYCAWRDFTSLARLKQRNLLLPCACSWLVTYSMQGSFSAWLWIINTHLLRHPYSINTS